MSATETTGATAGAVTTETEISLLDQVIGATKQTERDRAEELIRSLTEEALKGTVTFNRNLVVTFERALAGGGKGDHAIAADKVYNFGFAIHEDYTNARFHYVSLGYQFGLDQPNPGVKNYIDVQKK